MANFNYELLELSNTHNSIADWLIANPGKGQMGRCAAVFGYTKAWLSTLVHQDAFQAMLKHKQGQTYEKVIIPLHDKLAGLAHAGIERMGEIMEQSKDERLIRDITKDSLQALGYGASTAGPGVVIDQSVHLSVDAAALAEARNRRSQHHHQGVDLESPAQPPLPGPKNQAALVSLNQELELGASSDVRSAHVYSAEKVHRGSEGGGEI